MFRSCTSRDIISVPILPKSRIKNVGKADGTEMYGCDFCTDGGWMSETEVELHKTKKHFNRSFIRLVRNREDYCCICFKQHPDKESVIKHIKTEHLLSTESCSRVEREIFVCDMCCAIFFNKQNLLLHLRYAHLDVINMKHVKCLLCYRKIKTRNIPAHFYMHHIQSVSTCRICLTKFSNTRALNEHLKTHPYHLKCDMCYYDTNRVDSFQTHVQLRHKNPNEKVSIKVEPGVNTNLITGNPVSGDSLMTYTDSVVKDELTCKVEDDSLSDTDVITVIEVVDNDLMTEDGDDINTMAHNFMIDKDVKTADTMIHQDSAMTPEYMKQEIMIVEESIIEEERVVEKHRTDSVTKYFIPKVSSLVKLQRVAGIRGIKLTNDVHICVLCREICIGLVEMTSHIDEHSIKVEEKTTYDCSCGEAFSNKVLLKHHAFKTKHVLDN